MAPLMHFGFRKVLLLWLILLLFTYVRQCACSDGNQLESKQFFGRRRMLVVEEDPDQPPKKKLSAKNQTKFMKPNLSTKNQAKIKTSLSTENQTKLTKLTNSTKASITSILSNNELKKLNSTSQLKKLINSTSKASNKSNKTSNNSTKTSNKKTTSDLLKYGSPMNKATKLTSTKQSSILADKKLGDPESPIQNSKNQRTTDKKSNQKKAIQIGKHPSWLDQEDEDDLISKFRDLPSRLQQTLMPDLERISMTSRRYLTKANKEMSRGFKPYVGNKYAPTIASAVSLAFVLIPLLLVSLLVINRINSHFSLQKTLIFIQVYLSIYFCILCLTSLVTGLEPLKFFYATSQSTYVCLMLLQTLAYVLYLLLLSMYLVLVFATESGLGSKLLGLVQTFVGFAVGLHCYLAVFHRVVLHQPPKTNWKVHGIYATCFLVICLFATADRRKKSYLEDGGEEGKKN